MFEKIKKEVAPEFLELDNWLTRLPSDFTNFGETIYKLRNEIKVFSFANYLLNVKAFKVPNFFNRIVYQYFRRSKAARSYFYARMFLNMDIPTPAPVGYVECSENGLFTKSYYISLHVKYNYTLREVLDFPDTQKRIILKKWIQFTYEKLHKNKIFHLDYSPANILIVENNGKYLFSLVDLNRLSFGKVSFEKGLGNFCRLGVDPPTLEFVGSEYAKLRGEDQEKAAKMMLDIYRKDHESLDRLLNFKEILKRVFRSGRDEK